jgi:YidC/Oxa1 family membrane protein insertase
VNIPIWSQYVDFLEWVLTSIADIVQNGGLAIVIFTIIVKTILLPLTLKSIRSMKAMQDIQPKIKELQKKHGKNREELQKATMALYAQHQVNPVAGCLPMLIQIPIFFGVYQAITGLSTGDNAVGHFADGFLWLPSLGDADPLFILPIAAGLFQFIQMRMSRPANAPAATDPQQQIMNTVMNIMPIFVVVFGWTFASGAVLYWATQSIYSAVQQWFVSGWGMLKNWAPWLPEMPEHRRLGYVAPRDVSDVVVEYGPNGMPRAKGLMGRMQKRLEETQAMQDARRQELAEARGGTASKPTAKAGSTKAVNTRSGAGKKGAKAAAARATNVTADATATAPGPAATTRSPRKRSGSNRPTANRASTGTTPTNDTEPIEAEFVETDATEVEETTPAPTTKAGKANASYADRVTAATRRGPKSGWGKSSATPAPAEAGED